MIAPAACIRLLGTIAPGVRCFPIMPQRRASKKIARFESRSRANGARRRGIMTSDFIVKAAKRPHRTRTAFLGINP